MSTEYLTFKGDVGWYTYERVVRALPGNSAGWPCYEGNAAAAFPNSDYTACKRYYAGTSGWPTFDATSAPYVNPHLGNSASLIGGVFFGQNWPAPYSNCWIFGDFALNTISCLPWDSVAGKPSGPAIPIAQSADAPVRFVMNNVDGCMYYIAFCTNCYQYGSIRRLCFGALPSLGGGGGVAPPPAPAPGCVPTGGLQLPALPTGWQTIMYASAMSSLGVYRPLINNNVPCDKGGCNVEVDSSSGDPWKVMDGGPFSIGGRRFAKGFGVSVTSELRIAMGKRCFRFSSIVGVDDASPTYASAGEFAVRLDGRVAWNSTDQNGGRPLQRNDWQEMGQGVVGVEELVLMGYSPRGNSNPWAGFFLDWYGSRCRC